MTEREKLARYLYKLFEDGCWEAIPHPETKGYWFDKARHIIAFLIKQAGYVQLAEDQGLPEVPEMIRDGLGYHKFIKGEPVQKVYTDAQQAMLADNWKRIRRE